MQEKWLLSILSWSQHDPRSRHKHFTDRCQTKISQLKYFYTSLQATAHFGGNYLHSLINNADDLV